MSGWFDTLDEAGKKIFREHAAAMGKKASHADKVKAGRAGAKVRWKKRKEETSPNSPKP